MLPESTKPGAEDGSDWVLYILFRRPAVIRPVPFT